MNPRQILERYEVQPKKSLGQNFMHDPNMLDKIIATAGVTNQDTVLEIGCGPGYAIELLTRKRRARFVVGVDPSSVMLEQARKWQELFQKTIIGPSR